MLLLNGAFFFPGGGVLKCSPGFVLGNQGTPDTVLGITCLLLSLPLKCAIPGVNETLSRAPSSVL